MAKQVSIILQDTLQALGLKSLLRTNFNASVMIFKSLQELSLTDKDSCDIFITSESQFFANLSFFMLNKDKTVIVSSNLKNDAYISIDPSNSEENMATLIGKLFKESDAENNGSRLTQREISVLQLVAKGCLNKEIADQLNISVNTVLSHRKNITAKLGIKSVSGLSVYALMNGIVNPD